MPNYLFISLIIGGALAVNALANTNTEEQQDEIFEVALNLVEGASQESIMTREKLKKRHDAWELPDWIKKAAEKQEKRMKQMQQMQQWQDYPGWDEYDD